jgi:hypothetical protein
MSISKYVEKHFPRIYDFDYEKAHEGLVEGIDEKNIVKRLKRGLGGLRKSTLIRRRTFKKDGTRL